MAGFLKRLRTAWKLSRKHSAAAHLISVGQVGQPQWSSHDYEAFAKEGYQENDVGYLCVDEIGKAVASVPWKLFRTGRGDPVEIPLSEQLNNPGYILKLLQRPNPQWGGAAFLQGAIGYMLLDGNSFIEAVGPTMGGNEGKPLELWHKRPDRMKVIPGTRGVDGYEYRVGGGEPVTFRLDPKTNRSKILHLKLFNPLDDWRGMSPMQAAAKGFDLVNGYASWNKTMLDNGCRVGGVLEHPELLTDPQKDALEASIKAQFSGPNATREILIADGGVKFSRDGLSPREMDYNVGDESAMRKICRVHGVPSMLASIPGDNKYANMQEAREWFWLNTVVFYLAFLRDELNNWLCPAWGEGVALDFDLSNVAALSVRRDIAWKRAVEAKHLTVNQRLALTGHDAIEGGNITVIDGVVILEDGTVLVPAGLMPADIAAEGWEDSGTDADAEKRERTLFRRTLAADDVPEGDIKRFEKLVYPAKLGANGEARW
jgi:HK97 family phage portal protein